MEENDDIIIIPQNWSGDTLIDTDLDHALEATYSTYGVDLLELSSETVEPLPSWKDGMEGAPRHLNAGDDTGVLAIITGIFVLMLLGFRQCRRLFFSLFRELLGLRRRANVFDERTSNETRMMVLMAAQWSVYTALLLYSLFSLEYPLDSRFAFIDTVRLICITGGYYIFQLCAYWSVGYTFASPSGKKYFVQGFSASQSILGFFLVIPALVSVFYPDFAPMMLWIAAIFYFLARIMFIAKGFRIFYHKIESLLYFILYLCTLEIIPIILLYNLALISVSLS